MCFLGAVPAYMPVTIPTRAPLVAQQRVAISPRSHARLSLLAAKRFRGTGSISKLGAVVLDQYLAHIERAYFGAARTSACAPVPAAARDFDAVLFDMDGVLCDSEMVSREAGVALFDRVYGVSVQAADFAPFTGTGEANFLAGVAGVYGVEGFDAEEAKAHFFDIYTSGGYTDGLQPFPGVVGLVRRVKELGLKVAVASAADAVKVEANLAAIGLQADTFDFVTSSDDIVNKKPAPDVFLAAARGLEVRPDRCVVIEDAVAGVEAARAAGMRCIAVTTSLEEEALRAAGADVVRAEPALIEIEDFFGKDVFAGAEVEAETETEAEHTAEHVAEHAAEQQVEQQTEQPSQAVKAE